MTTMQILQFTTLHLDLAYLMSAIGVTARIPIDVLDCTNTCTCDFNNKGL